MYTSVIFAFLAYVASANAACGLLNAPCGLPCGLSAAPLAVDNLALPVVGGCGAFPDPLVGSCGAFPAPLVGSCGAGLLDGTLYGPGLCGSVLPLPRTISNTCTCTKTVVRPKVVSVVKNIPAVKRVVQNIATPVLEQQQYAATPATLAAPCGSCGPIVGAGLYDNGVILNNGIFGYGYGCNADLVAPLPCGL